MVFAVLAIVLLAWPVWNMGSNLEINRNESWNAWFIDAVLNGTPLYPGRDELIVNNYPPLSFYITALVAKFTGDTIFAGRLLSLISAFAVSAAAGLSARALGASRGTAALGACWLLATLAQFFHRFVGVNDPSLLGLAVMGLALAYFLNCLRSGRAVELAIACMVFAGFVKHNMPAIPLAALIWLVMTNRRAGVRAILFGAAFCAAGLCLCAAIFGPNFGEQMLMPREITFRHILTTINKLQWVAPALLIWAIWAWPNRRDPAVRFTALLLGLSLASGVFQAAGAGVSFNAYLEVTFASAIALALAFEGISKTGFACRFGTDLTQMAIIAILVVRELMSQQLEPYLLFVSPAFRAEIRQVEAVTANEIARIRSIPGPVSCSELLVCYRAGKAFVYDPFWANGRAALNPDFNPLQIALSRGIRFEAIEMGGIPGKKRLF